MPAAQPLRLVPSDDEVALYAAEMTAELRRLAQGRPRLRALACLLDMARLEAEGRVKDARAARPDR